MTGNILPHWRAWELEIADKLNKEIKRGSAAADFGKDIAEGTENWAKVVALSGAKLD